MLGQIICDRKKAGQTERLVIGDTAVLTVYVPEGTGVRSALAARHAAKLLWRQRIRRAAFPPDYAYQRIFKKRGILPPEETALRRACADKIVLCLLRQMGKDASAASVAIFANTRSPELDRAIVSLAGHVRYLTLAVPEGDALSMRLRLQYGIAARTCGAGESFSCDLALSWDGEKTQTNAPVLRLTDEALQFDCHLAGNVEIRRELLSALVQENPSLAGEVSVQSVSDAKQGNFP